MGIEEGEVVEGEEGEGVRGVDNGWRLEDWLKKKGGKKSGGTYVLSSSSRKEIVSWTVDSQD